MTGFLGDSAVKWFPLSSFALKMREFLTEWPLQAPHLKTPQTSVHFTNSPEKQVVLVSFLSICVSMSSPTSLTVKEKNYWIFHGKTHKQKEVFFHAPLEEMAVLITEGLDWFQSYSRTAAPFTQQKQQQQQKPEFNIFIWQFSVLFKATYQNPHTMETFPLAGASKQRELADQAFSNEAFSLHPQTCSLGITASKPWRRGWGAIIPFPLKAVVDGHFLIFFLLFPISQ